MHNHDADIPTQAALLKAEIEEEFQFMQRQNATFCQEAYAHIRRKGCNKISFQVKTGLSGKTYERIKSGSLKHPKLDTIMLICIGLDLGFDYGQSLFQKAGYTLSGSELQIAYRKILLSCRGLSIYQCNQILSSFGLPVLSKSFYA